MSSGNERANVTDLVFSVINDTIYIYYIFANKVGEDVLNDTCSSHGEVRK